jgi:hypothetical protein
MKRMSAFAVLAAVGMAASANAGTIFSSDFEAPTYTAGNFATTLSTGQNGWIVGAFPSTTIGNLGQIVNNPANAYAGSQYLQVNTTNFSGDSTSATYHVTYGYQGHAGLAGVDPLNPIIHTSLAINMTAVSGTRGGFATLNAYSVLAGQDEIGAIGIAYTGAGLATSGPFNTANTSYLYLTGNSAGSGNAASAFVFSGSSATSWLNGWIVVDMYFNYSTGLVSYAVNGQYLDSILDANGFNRAFDTTNLFDQADIQSERDRPVIGTTSTGGQTDRYDNYLIESTNVPVPGSIALVGAGGLIVSRRRRA